MITATLTSAATGKVTFYDGVKLLGTVPIVAGQAKVKTPLLEAGQHALRALYLGDATYAAQATTTISLKVTAVPGYGTLAPRFTESHRQSFTVAADFNNDGIADLAGAGKPPTDWGWGTPGVEVLLGRGDGTFGEPIVTLHEGWADVHMAAADFDGDGNVDLAVSSGSWGVQGGDATILLGNGDGTFRLAGVFPLGELPYGIVAADVNLDGLADLVPATWISNRNFPVLLGNGDGTFRQFIAPVPGLPYNLGPATAIKSADFNGDNIPDFLIDIPSQWPTYISPGLVVLGNGDGTFRWAGHWGPITNAEGAMTIGDFNADGKQDIVFGTTALLVVYLGTGNGEFIEVKPGISISGCFSIEAGDFNGDGNTDVVVDTGYFEFHYGKGDGTFSGPNPGWGYGGTFTVADFNGDGRTDLAVRATVFLGALLPDLTLDAVRTGNAVRGSQYSYRISVRNVGQGSTAGVVTLTYSMPWGALAAAMSGDGWQCSFTAKAPSTYEYATQTCTRSDALPAGQQYPDVNLTVEVAMVAPESLTTYFSVNGGGEENRANGDWMELTLPVTGASAFPKVLAVVDAGTGSAAALAPREHFTIYGENLAATAPSAPDSLYEKSGVSVKFGTLPVPIVYVGPGQINAVVPGNEAVAPYGNLLLVTVTTPIGKVTTREGVHPLVRNTCISLFMATPEDSTGNAPNPDWRIPIVTDAEYSLLGPPGMLVSGNRLKPAQVGDTIVFWGTGCGNPGGLRDDQPTPAKGVPMSPFPAVTVGGLQAPVYWAGLSPGWTGLCQFNITIPPDAKPVNGFLEVAIDGQKYQLAATTAK